MGRGSYIVRKHCEWSFPSFLGLVVKAQEVRRFGPPGRREWGYTTFARLLDAPGDSGASSFFVGLSFMYMFLDIASNGHGICVILNPIGGSATQVEGENGVSRGHTWHYICDDMEEKCKSRSSQGRAGWATPGVPHP